MSTLRCAAHGLTLARPLASASQSILAFGQENPLAGVLPGGAWPGGARPGGSGAGLGGSSRGGPGSPGGVFPGGVWPAGGGRKPPKIGPGGVGNPRKIEKNAIF